MGRHDSVVDTHSLSSVPTDRRMGLDVLAVLLKMIVLEKCYHIQCQAFPQAERQFCLELLTVFIMITWRRWRRLQALFLVVCDPSMN
jgi:hypothetical protein